MLRNRAAGPQPRHERVYIVDDLKARMRWQVRRSTIVSNIVSNCPSMLSTGVDNRVARAIRWAAAIADHGAICRAGPGRRAVVAGNWPRGSRRQVALSGHRFHTDRTGANLEHGCALSCAELQ